MLDGTKLPFTIAKIVRQPTPDATTFVTLGLSVCHRHFPSGAPARQELVFASYASFDDANIQGLLGAVGMDGVRQHSALSRGSVQGPAGPLFPVTRLEALYASLPAYFPDQLGDCRTTSGETHFMWLVPIAAAEAAFIRMHGWQRFEDLLVEQDPDLLDLHRAPIRLPMLRSLK
jgi:hypothetical protein